MPAMLERIEATLERFRIHFDSWARQSELEERLPELLPRSSTRTSSDGALWARSSAYGDEQDRVLLRSAEKGGTPTYRAADVAYLVDKLERGFDRAIYVLGADHHGTARWYAAVARMLGYDPERVEVLLYQFVHLTRGGEQTKMSKRRGDVVFLDEFMDEIGVDAARWYPRQPRPRPDDRDRRRPRRREVARRTLSTTCSTRMRGSPAILRNAGRPRSARARRAPLAPRGAGAVKRLTDFPVTVARRPSAAGRSACRSYAIRLADDFHRFYHECRVLGDPAQSFRLGLCRATQQVIARSLDLVGVEAPERM